MKTLTINIPKGFKVDSFNEKTGVINLAPVVLNIRERLQTWADVLEYHNHTEESFAKRCEGLEPDEIGYRKEKLIVSAYNEGKLPDWGDGTAKYTPWFNMPTPSGSRFSFLDDVTWSTVSTVGARLVFVGPDAKANMLDAVKKFLPEYEESRTL